MKWFRIEIKDEDIARGRLFEFIKTFDRLHLRLGMPIDLGIFTAEPPNKRINHYYLPPTAAKYCPEFVESFGASESDEPNGPFLRLIGGRSETFAHFFIDSL